MHALRKSRDYLLFAVIGLLIASTFSVFGGFCGLGLGLVVCYPLRLIGCAQPFNVCMIFGSFCGFAAFFYIASNFIIKQNKRAAATGLPGAGLLSVSPRTRAAA